MRQVLDTRVFIGNLADAKDKELLDKNNIGIILNVCNDIDTPYYPDKVLLKWGLDDPAEGLAPRNKVHNAVYVLWLGFRLAEEMECNILVHCAAGNNRSPLVVAVWLAQRDRHIPFFEAVEICQVKDKKNWMIDQGWVW